MKLAIVAVAALALAAIVAMFHEVMLDARERIREAAQRPVGDDTFAMLRGCNCDDDELDREIEALLDAEGSGEHG